MKLVLIRHGDPDYSCDSLTPKGEVEARLLAKYLPHLKPTAVYSSPLGRAHKTCRISQEENGFSYEILPWLREFDAEIMEPTFHEKALGWDLMPSFFTKRPMLYDSSRWMEDVLFSGSKMAERYEWVKNGLDELLQKHGYVHEGKHFRVERANRDTVVLFCHYGVICVILSILTGFSPYVFFQHFCALPSSVTVLATEEREEKRAIFRCLSFGDLSHLALGGEEPSFHARFCETFDSDERH